jgi:hypothetical protein
MQPTLLPSRYAHAIELDPTNGGAFEFQPRDFLERPDLALSLSNGLQVVCSARASMFRRILAGEAGQLDAALKRCVDHRALSGRRNGCGMAMGLRPILGTWMSHQPVCERANIIKGPARDFWSVHMSMGDRAGAQRLILRGPPWRRVFPMPRARRWTCHDRSFTVLQQYRERSSQHALDLQPRNSR